MFGTMFWGQHVAMTANSICVVLSSSQGLRVIQNRLIGVCVLIVCSPLSLREYSDVSRMPDEDRGQLCIPCWAGKAVGNCWAVVMIGNYW